VLFSTSRKLRLELSPRLTTNADTLNVTITPARSAFILVKVRESNGYRILRIPFASDAFLARETCKSQRSDYRQIQTNDMQYRYMHHAICTFDIDSRMRGAQTCKANALTTSLLKLISWHVSTWFMHYPLNFSFSDPLFVACSVVPLDKFHLPLSSCAETPHAVTDSLRESHSFCGACPKHVNYHCHTLEELFFPLHQSSI